VKVTILYFEGCPNHPPVVELIRRAVAEFGLHTEVEEVQVKSPEEVDRLCFLGSPTVHVDGVDIDPAARSRTDFAMSCRLYRTSDGLPSRAMLLAALGAREAADHPKSGGGDRKEHTGCCDGAPAHVRVAARGDRVAGIAAAGSIATAMLSSACCWVPMLLLAFGASAAGISAIFAPWRPVFVAVALVMLGLGFYLACIRKPTAVVACCSTEVRGRRFQRVTWSLSAALVAAFVFVSHYVGRLFGTAAHASISQGAAQEFVFDIDGMHCGACAVTLKDELVSIEGVQGAQVDYAKKTARVTAPDETVVARRLGYSATLRSQAP